jgi:myo-inositol-1(or 4)-monophosphatase
VLQNWVGRFSVRKKGPADLVTQADEAAQEAIRSVVLGRFPSHGFIGEELAARHAVDSEYCWHVDPLDGTTNYVHQVPHYCTSIGVTKNGKLEAACVFDPVSRECYTASRGMGAFLNGKRLRTSSTDQLAEALVAASFSAKVDAKSVEIDQFEAALLNCRSVRRTGSAALNLCYVAAGRFDGFWALTTKSWDVAAGVLLVEEAGGMVTHWRGEPFSLNQPHPIATANPGLHSQFLQLLAQSRPRE